MSKLLINESPLTVLPSLVSLVGLERAIILQQIHYACQQPHSGKMIDGHKYIWNTYKEWQELYFPFWKPENIQKHFLKLEKDGYLISCQPDLGSGDARKFYRVNDEKLGVNQSRPPHQPESTMGSTGVDDGVNQSRPSYNKEQRISSKSFSREAPAQENIKTEQANAEEENQEAPVPGPAVPPPLAEIQEFYPTFYPQNREQYELLRSVTDMAVWKETLKLWFGKGWSKTNILGMVDRYEQMKKAKSPPVETYSHPYVTPEMLDQMEQEETAKLRARRQNGQSGN